MYKLLYIAILTLLFSCTKNKKDNSGANNPDNEYFVFTVNGERIECEQMEILPTKPYGSPVYKFRVSGTHVTKITYPTEDKRLELYLLGGSAKYLSTGIYNLSGTHYEYAAYTHYREPGFLINATDTKSLYVEISSIETDTSMPGITYYFATGTFEGTLDQGGKSYIIKGGSFRIKYL